MQLPLFTGNTEVRHVTSWIVASTRTDPKRSAAIAWARISPENSSGTVMKCQLPFSPAQSQRGAVTLITTAEAVVARPLSTGAGQRVDRAVEMGGGELDIAILVLARPVFCCEQGAAMHLAEITIGEFVVRLCPGGFLVVDAKVPFAVFGHP